jgi:hypothetical protein
VTKAADTAPKCNVSSGHRVQTFLEAGSKELSKPVGNFVE